VIDRRRLSESSSCLYLTRRYGVAKVFWVKAIQTPLGRFALWIHEKANLATRGIWQQEIVRVVVRHPIHLPIPKQQGAGTLDNLILQCQPRLLLQDDFTDITRIHRYPAVSFQVELGATMLGFGDITALAKALEAQL